MVMIQPNYLHTITFLKTAADVSVLNRLVSKQLTQDKTIHHLFTVMMCSLFPVNTLKLDTNTTSKVLEKKLVYRATSQREKLGSAF